MWIMRGQGVDYESEGELSTLVQRGKGGLWTMWIMD